MVPCGFFRLQEDPLGPSITWLPQMGCGVRERRQFSYCNGHDLVRHKQRWCESTENPDRFRLRRVSPQVAKQPAFAIHDDHSSHGGHTLHLGSVGEWCRPQGSGSRIARFGRLCGAWMPGNNDFLFQWTRAGRTDLWELPGNRRVLRPAPIRLTAGPMNLSEPTASGAPNEAFVVGSIPRAELVKYVSQTTELVPYLSGISAEGVESSRDGL